MKRSTNIVLTLLAPAMAAFGCSRETPPDLGGGSFAEPSAMEQTADLNHNGEKTDEQQTTGTGTGTSTSHSSTSVHRGRGYLPIPIPIPMGGNRGRVAPIAQPRSTPAPSIPSAPTPSGNSVSRGGFGGTGSHLSGAS